MAKIRLYIAASLDGFIARKDGSLDWLTDLTNPDQSDYGYGAFISEIDTVLMGRKTYDEILSFGVEWPYGNCSSYILSRSEDLKITTPNTQQLGTLDNAAIRGLKTKSKADLWLVGGGSLISEFLNLEAIDEIMLCVIPVILGSGIPLFPFNPKETALELTGSKVYSSGAVMLTYAKK